MDTADDLILVVDDDLAVRESLKFSLELEGLTVQACASGAELLDHPALTRASCLVLDYKMPGRDGLEVLDRLASRGLPLPVIIVTGYAVAPLRRRAAAKGVRFLLEKPLSDSTLLDTIRGVLSRRASPPPSDQGVAT